MNLVLNTYGIMTRWNKWCHIVEIMWIWGLAMNGEKHTTPMCGGMFNYNFKKVKLRSGSTGFFTFWIDFGVLNRIKKNILIVETKSYSKLHCVRNVTEWYLHRWHLDFYDINEKSISTNFILFESSHTCVGLFYLHACEK